MRVLKSGVNVSGEPSNDEINKAIAEFMGYTNIREGNLVMLGDAGDMLGLILVNYTESLDALIPVVEKQNNPITLTYDPENNLWVTMDLRIGWLAENKSPSRALAMACYQLIKENHCKE